PWADRELAHKLAGAETAAPPAEGRGHLARSPGGSGPPRPLSEISDSKSEIPEGDTFGLFLRACFESSDVVSLAPGTLHEESGRAIPEHGGVNTLTRDEWLARAAERGGIARVFSSRHGLYIRINPVRSGADGTDADVTALRHVLVESDALPKPDQE